MPTFNLPDLEEKVLAQWEENNIFQKSLEKDSTQGDFVFYEGPPTANGKPGIHHVLARAFKDLIPRYKTMMGYRVERKAGWDTHGLPVELQVEKSLGISGKPRIEKLKPTVFESIKYFNEQCRKSVWEFKEEWERLTKRMGFWIDMDHPYVTYDNSYIESVWNVLKVIFAKGLIYQDYKVVPHCPRCGTALSSHEVALGYKEVTDNSVYIKFKLEPGQIIDTEEGKFQVNDSTFMIAWTTTPWTLPGNVALAVVKDIEYRIVNKEKENEFIIISEDVYQKRGELFGLEADFGGAEGKFKELTGENLVGLKYQPLFDIKQARNKFSHKVYSADFVSTAEGTGIVHTAVMYGVDDFELGDKIGLPKVHTVDENGNFRLPSGILDMVNGQFVKDPKVEKAIITDLRSRRLIFNEELHKHTYPFCWRCSTPLLYYAKPSWFIRMSDEKVKERLIKENNTIHWVPEHIKEGRFGEWLAGVKDWAISRERYWGTPLPFWKNEKGEIKVIGSIAELKSFAPDVDLSDLHRPFIDQVTWTDKDGTWTRIPEVLDVWFDSGAMPYAQHHYPFEMKDNLPYPADYICEAVDQTRGWFYTLLAISTLLDRKASFKNVICLGHINDAKGQKMSKSKGNIVDPWTMIAKYGIDSIRWMFYTMNDPGEPKNFDEKEADRAGKQVFMMLLNGYSFYSLYNKEEEVKIVETARHLLDQWILAKLKQLKVMVTRCLEQYDIINAGRSIQTFINELSTWYIRRSRERFKGGDQEAVAVLGYVLLSLSKLMAPFAPFTSDYLYQRLKGKKESVHLEDWPSSEPLKPEEQKLLNNMDDCLTFVEAGHAERQRLGIKIRQPLASAIFIERGHVKLFDKEYAQILKEELNIENVETDQTRIMEWKPSLDLTSSDRLVVYDPVITYELKLAGWRRELIRAVNAERKNQKLTINDLVGIEYQTKGEWLNKVIDVNSPNKEVLASGWKQKDVAGTELAVNDETIIIHFVRQ
ncbi:MAG: isoleucine--tRNA ligase [bacterium]